MSNLRHHKHGSTWISTPITNMANSHLPKIGGKLPRMQRSQLQQTSTTIIPRSLFGNKQLATTKMVSLWKNVRLKEKIWCWNGRSNKRHSSTGVVSSSQINPSSWHFADGPNSSTRTAHQTVILEIEVAEQKYREKRIRLTQVSNKSSIVVTQGTSKLVGGKAR